jgi:hypothetical protein
VGSPGVLDGVGASHPRGAERPGARGGPQGIPRPGPVPGRLGDRPAYRGPGDPQRAPPGGGGGGLRGAAPRVPSSGGWRDGCGGSWRRTWCGGTWRRRAWPWRRSNRGYGLAGSRPWAGDPRRQQRGLPAQGTGGRNVPCWTCSGACTACCAGCTAPTPPSAPRAAGWWTLTTTTARAAGVCAAVCPPRANAHPHGPGGCSMTRRMGLTGNEAVALAWKQLRPHVVAAYPHHPGHPDRGTVQRVRGPRGGGHGVRPRGKRALRPVRVRGGRGRGGPGAHRHRLPGPRPHARGPVHRQRPPPAHRDERGPTGPCPRPSTSTGTTTPTPWRSRDAGWVQVYARNVQDAYDRTLLAVWVAERARGCRSWCAWTGSP